MNFNINPCSATMKKMSKGNCDINKISDTCYSICNSYGKIYPDILDTCNQQCVEMVTEKKQQYGFNNCNKKRPSPSLSWNQIPAFFPQFLESSKNPKEAHKQCYDACDNSLYQNSCKERCDLDFSAIISLEKNDTKSPNVEMTKKDHIKKGNTPTIFLFIFLFIFLLSIFVLIK